MFCLSKGSESLSHGEANRHNKHMLELLPLAENKTIYSHWDTIVQMTNFPTTVSINLTKCLAFTINMTHTSPGRKMNWITFHIIFLMHIEKTHITQAIQSNYMYLPSSGISWATKHCQVPNNFACSLISGAINSHEALSFILFHCLSIQMVEFYLLWLVSTD